MCSNADSAGQSVSPDAELAERLSGAIDSLAAEIGAALAGTALADAALGYTATPGDTAPLTGTALASAGDAAAADLAVRLARLWAMITAADPGLAALAAGYAPRQDGNGLASGATRPASPGATALPGDRQAPDAPRFFPEFR